MDARKISKIAKDEVLQHSGNLIVEGDVEENAVISLRDGFLIISGNVKDGVRINLNLSQPRPFTGAEKKSYLFKGSNGFYCSMNGNVNIGNRILTDDNVLNEIGTGKYTITPYESEYRRKREYATATIDGRTYKGKQIDIDGQNILVDGIDYTLDLVIHGNVGNHVVINSDVNIEILESMGSFCKILANYSGFTAKNVGRGTKIKVYDAISVSTVENDCILQSNKGELQAENLKEDVIALIQKSISIKNNIGDGCYLYSSENIKANNLGKGVIIKASKDITIDGICPRDANLESLTGKRKIAPQPICDESEVSKQSIFSVKPVTNEIPQQTMSNNNKM